VREDEYAADLETEQVEDTPEQLVPRPPVVTIMGHVDHGKTSLLDYVRKANVVAGEAGGITQHIGAYHVTLPGDRAITFLDTPGHQAFTAMRARGAQVTDIVVLVVAADDQVMPQTVEAISHAKNAGVPIIVAINKIDLPSANVQKVKQDLLQHNVVLEEFGGNVLSAEISAKKGTGIDTLLEQILLQAEILDLKANPDGKGHGAVLEATLDPGKGPLATILVQKGTLRGGDNFICGKFSGRVRALYDERGKTVKEAGPSIPVQILGFEGVPAAGDTFAVVTDANEAREIAQKRQRLEREAQNRRSQKGTSLEDFSRALKEGGVAALRIIIKADQGGPAEALADALAQLSTSEVRVDVVHRGVGAISESDVLLAKASGAIILGFHVRPDSNARAAAEREQVDVRTYRIIYEAVEDVRNALGAAPSSGPRRPGSPATARPCIPARCRASSGSRMTCARCGRASSAASASRISTTSRSATGSSRSGWTRSSGPCSRPAKGPRGRGPDRDDVRPPSAGLRRPTVVIGIQVWDLHLPGCHSLKEKRGTLKPLTAALRQRLNVSVAETGHQDLWQRAEIACAAVGTARPVVEETLRAADRAIEGADGVRIVDTMTVWR
jgi:translation initiation factor IF-2